jgi:scaffold Nfu/NifU family protein
MSEEHVPVVEITPEPTPNPNAYKFSVDRPPTDQRSLTFSAGSDPTESPLGARIYALDGVTNVFMTPRFVSVTKEDDVSWADLGPEVILAIQTHFAEAG